MKSKRTSRPQKSDHGPKSWVLAESPGVYGRRIEVSVRQAKDNLSALLMRAAEGEEVIVTSDGKPKAMITKIKTELRLKPWRMHPELTSKLPQMPDSTPLIRDERDAKG